jgi:hypothetical protein
MLSASEKLFSAAPRPTRKAKREEKRKEERRKGGEGAINCDFNDVDTKRNTSLLI